MKSLKFFILDNALFWTDHEGILINCLSKEESDKFLQEFHAGDCGDTFIGKPMQIKSLELVSTDLPCLLMSKNM